MVTLSVASKSETSRLAPWRTGLWRWHLPQGTGIVAGVTDRTGDLQVVRHQLGAAGRLIVQTEQVHGASVAAVEADSPSLQPIPGCDALVTQRPGIALTMHTADCLPLVFWDPTQRVIGLAHVGWRGLVRALPSRVVSVMAQSYRSHPDDLWVAIGPAIRPCCYDVGPTFPVSLHPFVQEHGGRRVCDLVACARHQLSTARVRSDRILDSGQCTACQPLRWYSVRREGEQTGRLVSFIMLHS